MADEHPVAARAVVDGPLPAMEGPEGQGPEAASQGPGHALERPPYEAVPEADTLGVRHIAVALQDLPFPATAAEILARAGSWRIPVTGTHFHTLAEFMRGVPARRRFRTAEDMARAIGKAQRKAF